MKPTSPNQSSVKIVLCPIDHMASARHTRRTWQATLAERDDATQTAIQTCTHRMGHNTMEAAKQCGMKMWKHLPKAGE